MQRTDGAKTLKTLCPEPSAPHYSCRKATIGSILTVRDAGMKLANTATGMDQEFEIALTQTRADNPTCYNWYAALRPKPDTGNSQIGVGTC